MFSLPKFSLALTVIFLIAPHTICISDSSNEDHTDKIFSESVRVSKDDALFLTPYIENGQISEGQNLAKVPPMMKNIESYAGYLTVNKSAGSNLFFWLFKSQHGDWEKKPLIIWLAGGPGVRLTFPLFTELGPFSVTEKLRLKRRKYSWNRNCNLLFFDQPVGTGFSFTKEDSAYARDENDVVRDLYVALIQVYKLFPNFQENKLFITGESYAGKYVPAIAYKIFVTNKVSDFKIKIDGLMIGNGFTDPISIVHYASYIYELGLIDEAMKWKLTQIEAEFRAQIRAGQFKGAYESFSVEYRAILKASGLRDVYDFIHDELGPDGPEVQFVNDPKTRNAIHVGNNTFNNFSKVEAYLREELVQSVKPWLEELLEAEEFPIMFYSGQLDIIVAYPLSVAFYKTLQWSHAREYYKANRCQLKVGQEVAGYHKTAGTFTEVMVRNTGHMVPTTRPKWAFELMDRFITNSSSFKC